MEYPLIIQPKIISAQESEERYTLSESQREFYNRNGYLVISGLVGFDVIYACKKHFQDIAEGKVDKGSMIVMKEIALINSGASGERLINKIQDILYDDIFMTYTECPKLLDVVSQFIGPNVMAVHSMLINKPPGTTEHPPHQDLHYFPFRPVDKIIASWTAMEEVRRDNGGLYVVPGSHSAGKLYPHDYPKSAEGLINKAYHGIVNSDCVARESDRVHLDMAAGDTVFFHPLLVHGSGANVSQGYRKAISAHYASSECVYVDAAGTVQENVAREVVDMARKRGLQLTFNEAWQYRSKLVKGVKCNL